MSYKAIPPSKHSPAVTFILSGSTSLHVRFPIALYCILLRTPFTLPFLLAVFSTKVFLYPCKVTKRSRWVVVHTRRFWTNINSLANLFARSLTKLPWQVMSSSVKLEVLVSLKPFVTDLTYKSVCCH